MKLPNAEQSVVDIEKLRDYCLNPEHPRGHHKARVFQSALGLTAEDAEILRETLLEAAKSRENVELGEQDEYGQRYTLDFDMAVGAQNAMIRSAWIVRTDEDFPRLTTCYVL